MEPSGSLEPDALKSTQVPGAGEVGEIVNDAFGDWLTGAVAVAAVDRVLFDSFDSLTCPRSSAVTVNVSGLVVNGRDRVTVRLAPLPSDVT